MKQYSTLTDKEVKALERGDKVYVTRYRDGLVAVPGIVMSNTGKFLSIYVLPDDEDGNKTIYVPLTLDDGISNIMQIQVDDGLCVDTPGGTLWVHEGCSMPEYQAKAGVTVELLSKDAPAPLTLSWTEYIAEGEEPICSYGFPGSQDELREVPTARMLKKDGTPVREEERPACCKDACLNFKLSAGFVTRAWPNGYADVDYHNCTYHYGYRPDERNGI